MPEVLECKFCGDKYPTTCQQGGCIYMYASCMKCRYKDSAEDGMITIPPRELIGIKAAAGMHVLKHRQLTLDCPVLSGDHNESCGLCKGVGYIQATPSRDTLSACTNDVYTFFTDPP
jgi:hypothetical protein